MPSLWMGGKKRPSLPTSRWSQSWNCCNGCPRRSVSLVAKWFRQAKDVRSRVGAQVGLVSLRGKYTEVEPLFQKGPTFLLARGGVRVKTGDLVLFRPSHGRRVQVTKVIGRREVLQDVLDALLDET